MPYLLLSKSLTYAQRSARLLEQKGIRAILMKAPSHIHSSGCSYCVRIRDRDKAAALRFLAEANLSPQRIFLQENDVLIEVAE